LAYYDGWPWVRREECVWLSGEQRSSFRVTNRGAVLVIETGKVHMPSCGSLDVSLGRFPEKKNKKQKNTYLPFPSLARISFFLLYGQGSSPESVLSSLRGKVTKLELGELEGWFYTQVPCWTQELGAIHLPTSESLKIH
jgi:hypothetical protein